MKSVALLCFLNTAIADTGDTGSAGDTGITPEDTASGTLQQQNQVLRIVAQPETFEPFTRPGGW